MNTLAPLAPLALTHRYAPFHWAQPGWLRCNDVYKKVRSKVYASTLFFDIADKSKITYYDNIHTISSEAAPALRTCFKDEQDFYKLASDLKSTVTVTVLEDKKILHFDTALQYNFPSVQIFNEFPL